jgi:hypothetical protein
MMASTLNGDPVGVVLPPDVLPLGVLEALDALVVLLGLELEPHALTDTASANTATAAPNPRLLHRISPSVILGMCPICS